MIIAGILILISISLILFEQHAKNKRKKLEVYTEVIYTDFKDSNISIDEGRENIIDSLALGIGSSGLNMIDIYAATENHENVLDILSQRYPNELEGYDSMEWFNKVETIFNRKTESSYISAFKGQGAENLTVDFLKENGFENVRLFESLTHPNDDVTAELNGEVFNFSVKNGSVGYIKSAIENHPDSTHYVINHESYEAMLHNGDIEEYAKHGITILDGKFSLDDLTREGSNALNDIHDAGNVLDDIPMLAIAIFGVKTIRNVVEYKKNKQTKYEAKTNIAVDAGRVAVGGVFAAGGAKIGAAVGTFVAPGIGTLIGSGIGAISGAFTGGSVFNWVKESIKWGKIIKAIEYFGDKFQYSFSESMKQGISKKYFNYDVLQNAIFDEEKVIEKYKKEVNPYSFKRPSITSALSLEHYNNLLLTKARIEDTIENVSNELNLFCRNIAQRKFPNSKKKRNEFQERVLGDIVLSNEWLLKNEYLTDEERQLLDNYREQMEIACNHPYNLNVDKSELFDGLVYKSYDNTKVSSEKRPKTLSILIYLSSLLFLGIGIYLIIKSLGYI